MSCISELASMICYKFGMQIPLLGGASLQQIWLNLDKKSRSYKDVKIKLFVFLSICSWCGALASWTTQHTIMCPDMYLRIHQKQL